jgi:hypothetical protein
MKTLKQISKQYDIPKSTLISRLISLDVRPIKEGRTFLIDQHLERKIARPVFMSRESISLIRQFAQENQHLSISEVAMALAVKQSRVEESLTEEFILKSKL